MIGEMVNDLEIIHPITRVDSKQIATCLCGGPVELPIIIWSNSYPTTFFKVTNDHRFINVYTVSNTSCTHFGNYCLLSSTVLGHLDQLWQFNRLLDQYNQGANRAWTQKRKHFKTQCGVEDTNYQHYSQKLMSLSLGQESILFLTRVENFPACLKVWKCLLSLHDMLCTVHCSGIFIIVKCSNSAIKLWSPTSSLLLLVGHRHVVRDEEQTLPNKAYLLTHLCCFWTHKFMLFKKCEFILFATSLKHSLMFDHVHASNFAHTRVMFMVCAWWAWVQKSIRSSPLVKFHLDCINQTFYSLNALAALLHTYLWIIINLLEWIFKTHYWAEGCCKVMQKIERFMMWSEKCIVVACL